MPRRHAIPWLQADQEFPSVESTWGPDDPVPGLLAAGGNLSIPTLVNAYSHGIFPWFGEDQPILWWSPDPRMVLRVADFRLHPSLRKTIRTELKRRQLEIRLDSAFKRVIQSCAHTARPGQNGTWIVPAMVDAYVALHEAGHAHSVETWWDGELVGGLYCINLGRMVFGESMFSHRSNASKIALAALIACCQAWCIPAIDCQQNTAHLASLGAAELPRATFLQLVRESMARPEPQWTFDPVYWNALLQSPSPTKPEHT